MLQTRTSKEGMRYKSTDEYGRICRANYSWENTDPRSWLNGKGTGMIKNLLSKQRASEDAKRLECLEKRLLGWTETISVFSFQSYWE
jgi:hypothetical protein